MKNETPDVSPGMVSFEMIGTVAVLTIDNAPVNAGSHAVRAGLVQGIVQATAANATGTVLMGAGRCFVAGSDLREFGKPLAPPELPEVIRIIENTNFPVVAAMHGVALGGGLELSLGCDYRIAETDTKLGLPEVALGLVPGAGGTQRLPRLVGKQRAIEMICNAERLPAATALEYGLIDAVTEGDLLEEAIAFLRAQDRPKRLAIQIPPPNESPDAIEAAAVKALQRGKKRPNVAEAIRLVMSIGEHDADTALADERAVFQHLRFSEDAFALRYLFFSERAATSVDGLDMKLARNIESVGVVGGGTMGQGIVRAFLAAGLPVVLVERDQVALDSAIDKIDASLEALVAKGRLSAEQRKQRCAALAGAVEFSAISSCDLVIEAVFEEMSIKKDVLKRLEAELSPEAIIATNTSYLDIDNMVKDLVRPEQIIGLHFFSPADIMPLLEVVRTAKTSDRVLTTGIKLARKLDKQPIVARVAEGFIGNRIYAAYRRRAELLVLDGAMPEQVDAAVTGFGFAMGPFAVADMSGLDIAWAMRKRQAPTRDPEARYVTIPDSLCEAGRLGRKTGKGWYDYSEGTARPDPGVDAIIAAARAEAGIRAVSYTAEAIQRQLMTTIVNEATCLLDEGVAQRPSDVDVALTNGYGFPRWCGGPLYWASKQERSVLEADLEALSKAIGHGFKAGPVADILNQIDTFQES
ncbi:3-hydroxyacyl-CoA dehydrogenase NAD-binding domain-containing protein [Saccharospirillum sp.]|uniref:3-hydroxyacyl-CoA dehydrogenase NAD-binding domain-containing protein n=1 Tax=Saccharospirillum sp. TaxID=2033801 RepID=UPI0034A00668